LEELYCEGCPRLTKIHSISELKEFDCFECPWIEYNDEFKENLSALITIQKYIKKYHKLKICKRWVESDDFRHWYYHPDGPGGIKAVLRLNNKRLKMNYY